MVYFFLANNEKSWLKPELDIQFTNFQVFQPLEFGEVYKHLNKWQSTLHPASDLPAT
jgi:hypothetical protein